MLQLAIGKTIIPYTIRHSDTAQRKRIIVTPNNVEVVAPKNTDTQDVVAFIHKKRRWVYDKQEEMQEHLARFEQSSYMHLQSGAKIPFRGRNMRLRIVRGSNQEIEVAYQNGFTVFVPKRIKDDELEACVGIALTFWLKRRLSEDAVQIATKFSKALGFNFKKTSIRNLPKLWGSCTKQGVINLNWHLVAAPRAVLEYVVLHEICHLRHRNHSKEFWQTISSLMPDYESRKKWLTSINPLFKL
jgi:predicted metal-dependent hydrolase